MSTLVALASGKGGVGKSVLAANLSYQLASRGRSTVLVDLDFGGANAHTILGVLNTRPGVGVYMVDKEQTLADLRLPLGPPGLSFIPGDGAVSGAANLPFVRKQKLLRELAALEDDFVVLDLGAGSHFNTVDLFLASGLGFLVTTPEPTAILKAYSFLKTALYRLLSQGLPAKSEARALVQAYFAGRKDAGGSQGLDELLAEVSALVPGRADRLTEARRRLQPRVILNMVQDPTEKALGARLRQVCERQLGMAIEYTALVPWDPAVRTSVIDRQLVTQHQPRSPFSQAVSTLARRLDEDQFNAEPPMGTYTDLDGLDLPV